MAKVKNLTYIITKKVVNMEVKRKNVGGSLRKLIAKSKHIDHRNNAMKPHRRLIILPFCL